MGLSFLLLQHACSEGEFVKMRFVYKLYFVSYICKQFHHNTFTISTTDNTDTFNVEVNILTMCGLDVQ